MKITALVSAYYAHPFLEGRLENLAQVRDCETIVVCRMGSVEDQIASAFDVQVIATPDIPTIGAAWNIAIQYATGDYLTTANCDDRFHIGGLEYMAATLDEQPEMGLVFSQVDITDGSHVVPWRRIENYTGEVKNIKFILKQKCIIGAMPLWRKSIHDTVGLFREDYLVASDYDMWRRMAKANVRFYYIAESCGIYHRRMDSLEHRNREACRTETREVQS